MGKSRSSREVRRFRYGEAPDYRHAFGVHLGAVPQGLYAAPCLLCTLKVLIGVLPIAHWEKYMLGRRNVAMQEPKLPNRSRWIQARCFASSFGFPVSAAQKDFPGASCIHCVMPIEVADGS